VVLAGHGDELLAVGGGGGAVVIGGRGFPKMASRCLGGEVLHQTWRKRAETREEGSCVLVVF
jgi:hypothetical protein